VEVTREIEAERKKAGNCGNVEVANDNGKNFVVAPRRFLNTFFFSSNWTLSEELQF
jgi:hypothetical protein